MQIIIPKDCGNSPRMAMIATFVTQWMSGSEPEAESLLATDAIWERVGKARIQGADRIRVSGVHGVDHLEILSVINHGRTAACEGFMQTAGMRTDFCHIFQFTGAAKTAKIKSIRTFSIDAAL